MEVYKNIFIVSLWKYFFISITYSETIKLEIQGDQGHLQTPNYPASYPLNFTNLWILRGPKGTRLQLNFTDFNVESNKKCLYDYVLIGNDMDEWTSRYCGNAIPPGYVSTQNNIYVMFVSDKTTSKRGFKAKWMAMRPREDINPTATPSQPVTPQDCQTRHTITVIDPPCPEPSTESVTVTPCSCPTRTSTVLYVSPSSIVMPTSSSSTVLSGMRPMKGVVDAGRSNNTVAEKCPQDREENLKVSNTSKNQRLLIILGVLTAAFFFIDILLIALWCRRYKRNNHGLEHNCRTELPPIELKIVDGKVISSPRTAAPRVKFSDNYLNGKSMAQVNGKQNKKQSCRNQHNDGNGNHRKDRGMDLLKDSRYVDHLECSRLVSTHHGDT